MNKYEVGPVDGLGAQPHVTMISPTSAGGTIPEFFEGGVEGPLADYGSLLFRGFGLSTDSEFSDLVTTLATRKLDYVERSTKRTRTAENVYTSTEFPATKVIAGHSENSFQNTVPGKILFFAKTPSASGGETPFASNTDILKRLDAEVLKELRERQVRYIRNFDGGFDMSWQEAFQTEDRDEVENYCRSNAIDYEWVSSEHLRTAQTRPATRRHPVTGDEVWFNQLHLFHSSNLDPSMREALLTSVGEEGIPRNAVFGDGAALGDDLVEHVRGVIAESEVAFPWQPGDVLIGDNMLISHGRRPYEGDREIRVALVDPIELGES